MKKTLKLETLCAWTALLDAPAPLYKRPLQEVKATRERALRLYNELLRGDVALPVEVSESQYEAGLTKALQTLRLVVRVIDRRIGMTRAAQRQYGATVTRGGKRVALIPPSATVDAVELPKHVLALARTYCRSIAAAWLAKARVTWEDWRDAEYQQIINRARRSLAQGARVSARMEVQDVINATLRAKPHQFAMYVRVWRWAKRRAKSLTADSFAELPLDLRQWAQRALVANPDATTRALLVLVAYTSTDADMVPPMPWQPVTTYSDRVDRVLAIADDDPQYHEMRIESKARDAALRGYGEPEGIHSRATPYDFNVSGYNGGPERARMCSDCGGYVKDEIYRFGDTYSYVASCDCTHKRLAHDDDRETLVERVRSGAVRWPVLAQWPNH